MTYKKFQSLTGITRVDKSLWRFYVDLTGLRIDKVILQKKTVTIFAGACVGKIHFDTWEDGLTSVFLNYLLQYEDLT